MNAVRIAVGAFVAPWVAPAFFSYRQLDGGVSLLVAYLSLFFVGLPLLFLLDRLGWLNLPVLIFVGALSGAAVYYLFLILFALSLGSPPPWRFEISDIVLGAELGAAIAAVFGLISGIAWRVTPPAGPIHRPDAG